MLMAGLPSLAGEAGAAVAAGAQECAGPPIKLMSAAGVDVQGGFPALAQPEVQSGSARRGRGREHDVSTRSTDRDRRVR